MRSTGAASVMQQGSNSARPVPSYSDEGKEAVLRKMLPPHNGPLGELAPEEGNSAATLYNRRLAAREQGRRAADRSLG
jgi:hypothetical protein